MWDFIGSWPFVVAVMLAAVALLVGSWFRSRRLAGRGVLAAAIFIVATLGATVVMNLSLTIDGTTCNNTATPTGVHAADFDERTEAELNAAGVESDRFECRDRLRTRYLLIGAGYLVVSLAGAAIVTRRRSDTGS